MHCNILINIATEQKCYMYPNLYYVFKDLFGADIPFLKIINTFGFCVAISFLFAAWLLVKELKRKQALGVFTYSEVEVMVGKPATPGELLLNFILGFILGFKILGVFIVSGALNDPQTFLLSSAGSWPGGIALGLFFAFLKWRDKNKTKLAKPEKRIIRIWPSDRVGDITIIAAIAGFAGAKIFDNLENWDEFVKAPLDNLFSPSGLTFYGGLIVATLALWYYFHKRKINFIDVADAAAPSLMLAYGLGRIGCQVAGDGDWGILNSAYVTDISGKAAPSTPDQFQRILSVNADFYKEQLDSLGNIHHASVKAFWGLPDWLFAYAYPHNVNGVGIPMADCTWEQKYCAQLPIPVFPTPLYEIVAALLIFAFLWGIRKKITTTARLFAIYLTLNGIERFFIEKIRVNTTYSIYGFHPTQAEIISSCLIIVGIILYILAPKIHAAKLRAT